jgi:hypothetical protein
MNDDDGDAAGQTGVMLPRNGWLRSVQRSVPTPHVC